MPEWTKLDDAILKKGWARGESASTIGQALGRSRNAVIGRAHRLMYSPRVERATALLKTPPTRKGPRKRLGKPKYDAELGEMPKLKPLKTLEDRPLPPDCVPVLLKDSQPFGCRYAVGGVPPNHLFCDLPALVDQAWCAYHRPFVYRRSGEDR